MQTSISAWSRDVHELLHASRYKCTCHLCLRGSLSLAETSLVFWLLIDVAIQLVRCFKIAVWSNA